MKRIIIVLILAFGLMADSSTAKILIEADKIYDLRAEGFSEETLLASPTNINKAIALYKKAIETTSGTDKEEAIWKAMRAFYFKGRYATSDKKVKKAIYEEGKEIGVAGIREFPKSAAIHTWMAIMWGVWAEENGVMKSARKGIAGKIKDHCEKSVEFDETFDEASGYRILGRLHFKAPKIPLILRWPSKKKAIQYLEKAYKIAPQNPITKQYLAEALYDAGQKNRAMELMEEILNMDEDIQSIVRGVVEDAVLKKDVAEILKKWKK